MHNNSKYTIDQYDHLRYELIISHHALYGIVVILRDLKFIVAKD